MHHRVSTKILVRSLILAQEMLSSGIRAFVGKLSMDQSSRETYREHSKDLSVEAAAAFIERWIDLSSDLEPHKQLVHPVITPRFIPTCSNELEKFTAGVNSADDIKMKLAGADDISKGCRDDLLDSEETRETPRTG